MDINLDGGEKEILKAIGIGTAPISGITLIERVSAGMAEAEFISTLKGLLSFGYIMADKQAFHGYKDVEVAEFRVNAGYSKDLKDALDPRLKREREGVKSRRVRRE